jgi:monofunctional biosynthetic peptidoglycan transglycosylase
MGGTRSGRGGFPDTRWYRPVSIDSMSRWLPRAAMIGEDNRFLEHDGLDYFAILEAMGYRRAAFSWDNPRDRAEMNRALGRLWSRRDKLRGASTITQQLAKNLYLSPSRNPFRKVKEAATAYRIEVALSKRRIMELYLNVAELGPNLWGVEAASQFYYNRRAARLSAEQSAALVGSLPFPLSSNPGYRPGRMRWRQNLILRRMRGEAITIPKVDETDIVEPPPAPPIPIREWVPAPESVPADGGVVQPEDSY